MVVRDRDLGVFLSTYHAPHSVTKMRLPLVRGN